MSVMGLCHPHGMMECWNSGIMGIKIRNNRFFVFLLTPSFQYSIIPISQLGYSSWGKASKFLYNQQVTKILPVKVRKLQNIYL